MDEMLLILLTVFACYLITAPIIDKIIKDNKSLEFKNMVSEKSNKILRKENLILKQKLRKLERRMQYDKCNANSDNMCNDSSAMHN